MGRPEKPVDPDAGPVQRLAWQLRQTRESAGNPSYRALARKAHFSASTLADAAKGERLPSREVTLAYVAACGGDPLERGRHPTPAAPPADREAATKPAVGAVLDRAGEDLARGHVVPAVGVDPGPAGDGERQVGPLRLDPDLLTPVMNSTRPACRRPNSCQAATGSGRSRNMAEATNAS